MFPRPELRRWNWGPVFGLSCILVVFGLPTGAAGVTSESPEVKHVLQRGLKFLATAEGARMGPFYDTLGGNCLVATALILNGYPADHPAVLHAVDACTAATAGGPDAVPPDDKIYSLAIAAMFLCELEPGQGKYDREIRTLMEALRRRQKRHGGWGYLRENLGDTSMTQYGVLSAWLAHRAGFGMSVDSIERVCNWLLRTQDPSGSWGYKGTDPGDFRLVQQREVRHSVAAAGLGSVFICADMLGIGDLMDKRSAPEIPAALQEVEESDDGSGQRVTARVDHGRVRAAISRGNRWFESNFRIDPPRWTHYYLYALERYMTFRELAEGKQPAESNWYDEGFRYLAKIQGGDGSWSGENGRGVETAFSVLFLCRSTRQRIGRNYGEGTLTGGRGLPRNAASAQLREGTVVADDLAASADDLMRVLADADHPDHWYLIHHPDELINRANQAVLATHTDQLRLILRQGTPEARRVAVRGLSQTRDLDRVPLLVAALADPDWGVVLEADNGLRLVSRRFEPSGLPARQDEAARQAAIQAWKEWYLTMRPDAEFEDE